MTDQPALFSRKIDSPIGQLTVVVSDAGVRAILWPDDDPARVRLGAVDDGGGHSMLDLVEKQLEEYFAGTRRGFHLRLDFQGTDFQKQVWIALLGIPFGQTRSYAEIARTIGRPGASRAVGAANGRNPISIVAPCHRVIGAKGALTGFAGGMEAKAFLLALESGQTTT